MAGLTKEQRAEREKQKLAEQKAQLELLTKLAKGEISPEEAQKALEPQNVVREITVERVKDKDGKPTEKVKVKGIYAKFPITLYAKHILKLQDGGHWDKMVALAREIEAEGETLDVDAPPADEAASPAA